MVKDYRFAPRAARLDVCPRAADRGARRPPAAAARDGSSPPRPTFGAQSLPAGDSWEHEGVVDKMQARLDRMQDAMTIRRQTGEHPFAILKAWMDSTHFLTRILENVKTEMSLQVLAYNMKRIINLFGVKPLMKVIAV